MSRSVRRRVGGLVRVSLGATVAIALALAVAVPAEAVPSLLPPDAPAASMDQGTGRPASSVPPIDSAKPKKRLGGAEFATPAPDGKPDASVAKVDLAATPPVSATSPDLSKATVIGRSEYSDNYEDASGQKWMSLSPTPKNVKNAAGSWVPLSDDVTQIAGGVLSASLHPLAPKFAANANDSKLLQLKRNGHSLSLSLEGAAASGSSLTGLMGASSGVTYKSVLPGADLAFQTDGSAVREQLVLSAVPSGAPVYRWRVDAGDLTFKKGDGGDLDFVDAKGTVIVSIPQPNMWDSKSTDLAVTAYSTVDTTVTHDGSSYVIELRPDPTWLQSPDRVFPVFVDPDIYPGGTSFHAYRSDGATRSDGVLVGNSVAAGNTYWRTEVTYDYSAAAGKEILGGAAGFSYANEGTTTYRGGWVWSAACLGYACNSSVDGSFGLSTGFAQTTEAGIAVDFNQRVAAGDLGHYLEIAGEEIGTYTFKKLYTSLWLNYKDYPSVTAFDPPSPANGATNSTLKPLFKVEGSESGLAYAYNVWDSASLSHLVWSSPWSGQTEQVPQGYLSPGTQYWWAPYVKDGYDGVIGGVSTQRAGAVRTFTTDTPAPAPDVSSVTPVNGSVVTTLTPTLSGTAASGAPAGTKYQFRITTGADGVSGAVISSDWSTTPSWTVPAGVLQDGGSYVWRIVTDNGIDKWDSSWKMRLKINRRIGASGPSPQDTEGPVTVNMANGNASFSFSSPTISTIGGPIGEAFSYNSQLADAAGLTGRYYDATPVGGGAPVFTISGTSKPILTRVDPGIDFNWAAGSPGPGVPSDAFMAEWKGFITLPAGTYSFGVTRDDGARAWVNGTQVVDQWADGNSTTALEVQPGTNTITSTGVPLPITVDYYDRTSTAALTLYDKASTATDWSKVPPTAFTRTFQSLPAGWGASTALAGAAGEYSSAQITDGAVTVTDVTGSVHTYTKTSTGGYQPPAGEYGVVALDVSGRVSLTDEDGTVYFFDGSGRVSGVSSPADAKKPANPVPSYRSGTGQVDWIADALSTNGATPPTYDRKVVFAYGGDLYTAAGLGLGAADSDATSSACPVPAGFTAPPPGMLCRIIYPGHVAGSGDTSQLFYNAAGQLDRIQDPGGEITDFGYDARGRVSSIRGATANDWLAFHGTSPSSNQLTEIAYDSKNRVSQVTLPAPDGVTASSRPSKTYTYSDDDTSDGSGTTYMDAAGLTPLATAPGNGHAATVTFDAAYRQLSQRSAMGIASSQTWSAKDQLLSATDAAGRESTTIYDPSTDRVTDTYGPAPAACFDANRLPQSCSSNLPPAHTHTGYDEDSSGNPLLGLNVEWWNNTTFTGAPVDYSLGYPGSTGGQINSNWGTGAPAGITGIGADNFSARGTGYVTFPTAGNYQFQITGDDSAALWIDDNQVVTLPSNGTSAPSIAVTASAGQKLRIRLDYTELTSGASLTLSWKKPGDSGFTAVPGTDLTPDYGLTTSSHSYDAAPSGVSGVSSSQVPDLTTRTSYTSPWLGLATQTSVDPAGLNLRTTNSYETLGTGYLRPLSQLLPAQTATGAALVGTSATNSAYWGAKEQLGSVICGLPATTPQSGMLKSVTTPAPAAGSAIETDYVYDLYGRTVGTKRTGDSGWTCTSYDSRWRPTGVVYPAYGLDTTGHTATSWYTADGTATGDPLVSKASDPAGTITTVSDLLGRTVTYTDVWGTVATYSYQSLTGFMTQESVVNPGKAAKAEQFHYDADGRTTEVDDGGNVVALVTYDTVTGELTGEDHSMPSGEFVEGDKLSGIVRDTNTGALNSETWTLASRPTWTDTVTRSQTGRILQDVLSKISGGTTTNYTSSYDYDAAGRLIEADIPHHILMYSFAQSGACGASPSAGQNGDRTATSDIKDGSVPFTTSYCYDNADRLTSSLSANVPTGLDPANAGLSSSQLAYDAHGNTTTLADQTLGYDEQDEHNRTILTDGTTVSYLRDVTGRIVQRTVSGPTGSPEVERYTYIGSGDAKWGVLDGSSNRIQRIMTFPAGDYITVDGSGNQAWYGSDIHGDTIRSWNTSTTLQMTDPFGQPLDPTTGALDTTASDDQVYDNSPGAMDTGWAGAALKPYEHQGDIATIEMGARQYLPALGRFLETDPVRGGNCSTYAYPNDPLNSSDPSGAISTRAIANDAGVYNHPDPVYDNYVKAMQSGAPLAVSKSYTLAHPVAHLPPTAAQQRATRAFGLGANAVATAASTFGFNPVTAEVADAITIVAGAWGAAADCGLASETGSSDDTAICTGDVILLAAGPLRRFMHVTWQSNTYQATLSFAAGGLLVLGSGGF